MINDQIQKLIEAKQAVLKEVMADGQINPTTQNAARLFFDQLDLAGFALNNLGWLQANMPKLADAAAEQAADDGTIKFPGSPPEAPEQGE